MSDEAGPVEVEDAAPEIDSTQVAFALEQLRSQQNLVMGALAGAAASAAGAGIWAAATLATGYQIGFMAIGVGFLVGYAVRLGGKGIDSVFGIVGAVLAGVGCAVGNLLVVCGMVANQEGMAFVEVLGRLDPALIRELMVLTFDPMDLLFYGIAIYEGYKLSFRQLTPEALSAVLPGQ